MYASPIEKCYLVKDMVNISPRKVYEKKAEFFMQSSVRHILLHILLYEK